MTVMAATIISVTVDRIHGFSFIVFSEASFNFDYLETGIARRCDSRSNFLLSILSRWAMPTSKREICLNCSVRAFHKSGDWKLWFEFAIAHWLEQRLCRLPCGKARSFRLTPIQDFARLSLAKGFKRVTSVRQSLTARKAAKPRRRPTHKTRKLTVCVTPATSAVLPSDRDRSTQFCPG
jgi:hypothetical protein